MLNSPLEEGFLSTNNRIALSFILFTLKINNKNNNKKLCYQSPLEKASVTQAITTSVKEKKKKLAHISSAHRCIEQFKY